MNVLVELIKVIEAKMQKLDPFGPRAAAQAGGPPVPGGPDLSVVRAYARIDFDRRIKYLDQFAVLRTSFHKMVQVIADAKVTSGLSLCAECVVVLTLLLRFVCVCVCSAGAAYAVFV